MRSTGWIGNWAAGILTAAVVIGSAAWAQAGETAIYGKSGWYTWDERVNGGSFVKEKGFLHAVGVTRKDALSALYLAERLEVWGGNLDYDGHDVTGTTPIKSDTSYLGTREEVALSVRMPATATLSVEPFGGIGHKFWIRTRSSENWNTIYGRVGIAGEATGQNLTFFVRGGTIIPFYTRTHVTLSDAGFEDVVTYPDSRLSAFAEGGVKAGAFSLSVEYEGMEFGESPKVATRSRSVAKGTTVVGGEAYQPASSSNFVSLKLTYTF